MAPLPLIYHAAASVGPVVLGLRLRPYTLGHAILLHRLESSLVRSDRVTEADVAVACYVLSAPWQESAENLRSSTRKLQFWLWAKLKFRNVDWAAEAGRLLQWMAGNAENLRPMGGGQKRLHCPAPERALLLLTGAGIPVADALDIPVHDVDRLALTWAEAHGHCDVWTDWHDNAKAAAEAHAARIAEEYARNPQAFHDALARGVDPMAKARN
jgi:hypothetical protein